MAYTAHLCRTGTAEAESAREAIDRLLGEARSCRVTGGFAEKDFEEALFAVSAWVDETLLTSGWERRDGWRPVRLQRRLFATSTAGEEFFERLDTLEQGREDVREVYAACLRLGFTGRYHTDPARLRQLSETTVSAALGGLQHLDADTTFPQAYGGAEATGRRRFFMRGFRLGTLLLFLLPPAAALLVYYLFTTMLHTRLTTFFGMPI
jgi:type VI secretion system protein ImpK